MIETSLIPAPVKHAQEQHRCACGKPATITDHSALGEFGAYYCDEHAGEADVRAVPVAPPESLPPWDWAWPRSEAYEAAATAVLPAGWVLYSVLTEHSPTPEIGEAWARIAGKDFGATRHDARAHVFGVREIDGSAKHLRAEVRGLGDFNGTEQNFEPGDLAAACAWCDEQIAGRS